MTSKTLATMLALTAIIAVLAYALIAAEYTPGPRLTTTVTDTVLTTKIPAHEPTLEERTAHAWDRHYCRPAIGCR